MDLYSSKFYLAAGQSQYLIVTGRDDAFSTLCHSSGFDSHQREVVHEWDSLTMVFLDKFNERHATDTKKFKIRLSLKWSIIKSIPAYSSISKKYQFCLQEQFEIIDHPNPNELLNKRSGLISRCCHVNKFLLSTYKSND